MKFNYGKIFLLGFGFFGVSVIWGVYNAFVPIFLANKFHLSPAFIGFFMTLDNIAALFIQPPVGAWSDRLRTPIGRRLPFILIGAPITALAFGFIPLAAVLPLFVACTSTLLLSAALWRTPARPILGADQQFDKQRDRDAINAALWAVARGCGRDWRLIAHSGYRQCRRQANVGSQAETRHRKNRRVRGRLGAICLDLYMGRPTPDRCNGR